MKKIILWLVISVVILFTLTSCKQNENYNEHMPEYGPQFILLEAYDDPYLGEVEILVDKNTRVMYLYLSYCNTKSNGKALTVLYDSEGNVRRYTGAITCWNRRVYENI